DGADHRDQEHHARDLEIVNVFRIEHETERLGVANIGRDIRCNRLGDIRVDDPPAPDQEKFGEEYRTDHQTNRQIFQKALTQLGEIDIEHHDHEQKQHRNAADIYHDQNHRQELGSHQNEQARSVDESQDKEKHRVHGV